MAFRVEPRLKWAVEPDRIAYFARLRGADQSTTELVAEARALATTLQASWSEHRTHAACALSALGVVDTLPPAMVSVLPPSFGIGACDTASALILYGQPSRCACFAAGILTHELAHIAIAARCAPSRVLRSEVLVEALCFLAEAHVHCARGHALRDVWSLAELDEFHRAAFTIAMRTAPDVVAARERCTPSRTPLCALAELVHRESPSPLDGLPRKPRGLRAVLEAQATANEEVLTCRTSS